MAKSVASMSVSVSAKTKDFRKGMSRAQKALRKFRKGVKRTVIRLAKFTAALVTAAFAGIALFVRRTMKSIDALGKYSTKVGIATEELAAFHLAAQLAGIDVRTFDMGIQRMTRRLSEAAIGTGEAKQALIDLGVDAKKLNAAGPAEAFRQIIAALQKIPNQADRVRMAFKLFDSEGVALVVLADELGMSLEEVQKLADRLGLSLSAIDVEKVEQANDAITILKAAFQGAANILTVELAPMIRSVAKSLVSMGPSVKTVKATIGEAFQFMMKAAMPFKAIIEVIRALWYSLKTAVLAVTTGIVVMMEKMVQAAAAVEEFLGLNSDNMRLMQAELHQLANTLATDTVNAAGKVKESFQGIADVWSGKTLKQIQGWYNKVVMMAEAAASKTKKKASFLKSFDDSLKAFLKGGAIQRTVGNVGTRIGQLLGKGVTTGLKNANSLLFNLLGAAKKGGTATSLTSSSFQEIDPTRVAIGGLRSANKLVRVTDPANEKAVSILDQQLAILRGGIGARAT